MSIADIVARHDRAHARTADRARRLTRAIGGLLRHDPSHDASHPATAMELSERASTQAVISAIVAHETDAGWVCDVARLPPALTPAPGRVTRSQDIDAAGFADREAASVGVDLARWRRPPCARIDAAAWRHVFDWVVGSDDELSKVSVLTRPAPCGDGIAARYGYEAEGVPGTGVLQVAPLADGRWRIVDCWGDACEADRVQELADAII